MTNRLRVLSLALVLLTAPFGVTRVSGQTDPGVRRLAILHGISAPNKLTLDFYDELARRGWVRDNPSAGR